MFRIGQVGGKGKRCRPPPKLTGGAEGFDYDPDDPVDRAALQIATAHQKRRYADLLCCCLPLLPASIPAP
jgi:hypothetical protein